MSSSSKKKLRKEQESAKLTEKQRSAQKEARKTNLYTIAFVAVMAIVLVVAICVGVNQTITSHGVREKKTVAMTVNDHKISNAELNYFYMDYVNNFYNTYGSYASMLGLDATKPLDEQVIDEENGTTWADNFMESAKENAKSVYALADEAKSVGFTLSEEDQAALDNNLSNMSLYAKLYGYSDMNAFLKAQYGHGASEETYRAYSELRALASAYQTHYSESLTYSDADLRAADSEAYDAYTYNTYYLAASRFLEGGTTAEDGTTTYTDEERAAAVAAAEEAAKSLTGEEIATLADLDAAIAALPVNADTTASSSAHADTLSTAISGAYADWVKDDARKEGDITYVASTSTSTGEDGSETTTTDGYYVIYYIGSNDNTFPLKNVRHILVSFEGGTTDSNTNVTTYSDEEKAAAKEKAEDLLNQWKSGDATEDSFAALATENSTDPGSVENGGLYESIYPGQMVAAFNDWCFDESRKSGDTGIVETNYGYHVMYFVGDAQQNYRDYLITNDLRTADVNEWYTNLIDSAVTTDGDTRYIRTDLVLNRG